MEVKIKNCFRCRKLFVPLTDRSSTRYCIDCMEKENSEYIKVRNYLLEFPNSGIEDLSMATGVSEEIIIKFLKEGKIEITSENCILNCEKCLAPIKSGRYCPECTRQLSKNLTSIYNVKDDESAVASILTKIQLRDRKK